MPVSQSPDLQYMTPRNTSNESKLVQEKVFLMLAESVTDCLDKYSPQTYNTISSCCSSSDCSLMYPDIMIVDMNSGALPTTSREILS